MTAVPMHVSVFKTALSTVSKKMERKENKGKRTLESFNIDPQPGIGCIGGSFSFSQETSGHC